MDDFELIFNMLGERSTTEIHRLEESRGVPKLKQDASRGGRVAGIARKELEKNVVVAEAAIATAELKLKNLTIELEKPQTYADGGRALRLNRDVMATQEEIARLTEAWEKALARVEATNSAD